METRQRNTKGEGSKSIKLNLFLLSFIPMVLMAVVISVLSFNGASVNRIFLAIIGIILMATIAIVIISGQIAKAIQNAKEGIIQISKGNINITIDEKTMLRNDEIGEMGHALDQLRRKLMAIVSDLHTSSHAVLDSGTKLERTVIQTSDAMHVVSGAMDQISESSVNQTNGVQSAFEQTKEMAQALQEILNNVNQLDQDSKAMEIKGQESIVTMKSLYDSNDQTNEAIQNISEQIHLTNEAVQKINTAIQVIANIANQTSLLALNASIEAARAGENGRGFAVVADEIGKLSMQSNDSAKGIDENLKTLNLQSETTVQFMSEVVNIIKSQNNTAATEETNASVAEAYQSVESILSDAGRLKSISAVLDEHVNFFTLAR